MAFEPNPAGIEDFARADDGLAAALLGMCEEGAQFARSIAPEGHSGPPEYDIHPGEYKNSFSAFISDTEGVTTMVGVVNTDDPLSLILEYGSIHNPKFRVMGRTLDFLAGI